MYLYLNQSSAESFPNAVSDFFPDKNNVRWEALNTCKLWKCFLAWERSNRNLLNTGFKEDSLRLKHDWAKSAQSYHHTTSEYFRDHTEALGFCSFQYFKTCASVHLSEYCVNNLIIMF